MKYTRYLRSYNNEDILIWKVFTTAISYRTQHFFQHLQYFIHKLRVSKVIFISDNMKCDWCTFTQGSINVLSLTDDSIYTSLSMMSNFSWYKV